MLSKQIYTQTDEAMQKTLLKLRADFSTLRTGRANSGILDNIRVDYYGSMVPLSQIAGVATPEARTLEVRPWDKGALASIERAILQANIGLTPNNDGAVIRLQIPTLTEERRKDLIRMVRKLAEEFRVTLRNERRDGVDKLKKAQKTNEISEDELKKSEQEIQKLTDSYIKKVDEGLASKEHDIMEV